MKTLPKLMSVMFLIVGVLAGVDSAESADIQSPPPHSFLAAGLREDVPRPSPQRPQRPGEGRGLVFKSRITPHWFDNNTRFWYRNDLGGDAKEFVLVDVEGEIRQAAFDHEKLAVTLSKATGIEYQADKLPFNNIEFTDDSQAIQFKVDEKTFKCDLASYECSETEASPTLDAADQVEQDRRFGRRGRWRAGPQWEEPQESARSPDSKWTAFVKDNNVFVRSEEDGEEIQVSQDGREGLAYGRLSWAPDSQTLVAFRIEPGEDKKVYLIESSPEEGGRAKFRTRPYTLPGDKLTTYELNLFKVAKAKQIKPKVDRIDLGWPWLHWKPDGRHFTYQKTDRGHQRFRIIEVDSHTGKVRNIIDEKSESFIWTAHAENVRLRFVNWLEKTDEIIYASERDGWRHLYLIDAKKGKVKTQITKGEYVVRGIDHIDEEKQQIWFSASGKNPDQDPYLLHHYRVNFDGTGLVALTEGNGNHTIQYSPDRKYIIDSYSRVDMAPVHELRCSSDGKLVCKLEKADITELVASGWEPPEVFIAKGRDGKTDIWGIICRPRNFDPNYKYPVIEQIYAGPQGAFVPKTFRPNRRFASLFTSLTDLGFIVVQMDGMGTTHRSKAFHDVCWKNLKDAGFPDRILWHKAVAKKYPYYDISQVGIYGNSAGGQNAAGAVLFHPEFYKAAVASCGCHDNRMDKASWNEQWMGYPVGPQYAECSNIENAHRLRGKLLLIVGEMDTNVPPESTLRLVDALIKAEKDFELLVIPGGGHGMGGDYGRRRMQDFFVRHLLGVEPPDRNAAGSEGTGL